MIKRARRFMLRVAFTVDFLYTWGERATPSNLRYVWAFCEDDFNESLEAAIAAGDIPRDKYF